VTYPLIHFMNLATIYAVIRHYPKDSFSDGIKTDADKSNLPVDVRGFFIVVLIPSRNREER
jgi:hypothetical protein